MTLYGIIEDPSPKDQKVTLKGTGPDGNPLSFELELNFSECKVGSFIHKLAAKQIIR